VHGLRRRAILILELQLVALTQHVQGRGVMDGSSQLGVLGLAGVHLAVHVVGEIQRELDERQKAAV